MCNVHSQQLAFYQTAGCFSDISSKKALLSALPTTIADLFHLTQSLIIYEDECQWAQYEFVQQRYTEANIRSVNAMLDRLLILCRISLIKTRTVEQRLISSCRGASLLLVALLRAQNIPSRLRVGFATYHPIAPFYVDHVVVEYFFNDRWHWADVLLTEQHQAKNTKVRHLNPLDLDPTAFIPAEQAWQRVRVGQEHAQQYAIGLFKNRRGLFVIRNKLMHAFVAQLKYEMLPGDLWGYMLFDGPQVDPVSEQQLCAMDCVAALLKRDNISDLQVFYQTHAAFKIPSMMINHHSILGTTVDDIRGFLCV